MALSLFCAVMGQIHLANEGIHVTAGLVWFFAAVVLLIIGLWPWQRERMARLALSSTAEWTVFTLILALAAFLRTYKLDVLPSGVFIDMGFQGLMGLRVLHEHLHPFELNIGPGYPASPVTIYLGALWFIFAPNTQFSLNLMYALMCLASFPLIYWTFRQLAGPRIALVTLFILAVMRWNINFARNSFPPTLLPFFMFGCLGFMLYGFRTRKLWAFLVAASFSAVGLYAYQSHQVFPLAVLLFMVYEAVANWGKFKPNLFNVVAFWALFTVLSWPIYGPIFMGRVTDRQAELSIFSRCKAAGSYAPLAYNTRYTALMFNRRGDPNPRHNLQDHRQLDDVTGALFFLGVFFALSRVWRRKYFWGVTGAAVMAIPCLITVDVAHSSRMHGMTPFVAFLAACVLGALWGRLRAWAGDRGDWIWIALAAAPLGLMAQQNYSLYFGDQLHSYGCWSEYSTAETMIGKEAAKWGAQGYDCYISPPYWGHYTVDYFTYFSRSRVFRFDPPGSYTARPTQAGGGLWFGLEKNQQDALNTLRRLYPDGEVTQALDPNFSPYVLYFRVPPEEASKRLGSLAVNSNRPQ